MESVRVDVNRFNTTEIAQMFSDYVGRMQDTERHTKAACKEVEAFDLCCSSEFPYNYRLQSLMYEKMMNCAVEFEESGFIAGFQTAVVLLFGQNEPFSIPTQIPKAEQKRTLLEVVANPKEDGKEPKSPVEFRKNPSEMANFIDDSEYIKSTQIAEFFETSNFKVVRRIENLILPYCDSEQKKHFIKIDGYNIQHKKCVFYKLDSVACKLYLKELEPKRKSFVNIAGGYAKMQEVMQKMFPTEKVHLPAQVIDC